MSDLTSAKEQESGDHAPRASGSAPGGSEKASRLRGVDGLRALAALWVVLFHIRAFSGAHLSAVPGLDLFARSGSTGVSLFLVLSGFCLYLPFAGGRSSRFRTTSFLTRRGRRLLPAYYVSLVLVVIAILVAGRHVGLQSFSATGMTAQLATHTTFTHQLFPSTFYALNGSYWSLGLEWELYLTLPLLVFGARRIGLGRTIAGVIAVNVVYVVVLDTVVDHRLLAAHSPLATTVLPNLLPGRWTEFALGMVAAELFATGRARVWARRLWYLLGAAIPIGLLLAGNPAGHLVFGVVFFILLCIVLSGGNLVFRVISSRGLAFLGVMSYSLYLVHQPLIQVGASVLGGPGVSPDRVFVELVLLVPVILLVAWLLFVTVERRTVTTASLANVPGRRFLFPSWPGKPVSQRALGRVTRLFGRRADLRLLPSRKEMPG